MKILHYVDENRLSWAKPWVQLLSALQRTGFENHVLCRPGGTLGKIVEGEDIPCSYYRPIFPSVPLTCKVISESLKKIKPDIIHTRLSSAALIAGYWGRKMGIRVLSTVDKFPKGKYYRYSDGLMAVSEAVASHCRSEGFPDVPIHLIPNSIDVERYKNISFDRDHFRVENGVSPGTKVILGAGRFVNWKGFDVLVRASSLVSRDDDVELWLAGEGPEKERLKEMVIREGIQTKFWGFVEDVRPLMWSSDIFVLPSREPEPFGLVLLEAMAAGVTVLATRAGGPLDILEGSTDNLFACDDAEELSHKIRKNLINIDSYKSNKCFSKRAACYDNSNIAKLYSDLYTNQIQAEV